MNSEISYARYYRPNTLEGYIGNEKIKETVRNVLKPGEKKPQSILLTGHTGCGKTTLARIIASWYMCENPREDGSPCGECQTCEYMKEYIQTGNNEYLPDIKEIDSSEKSGKNDMAGLLEEIGYLSFGGGWKIYLFDEAHALSQGSSTLLLKPLEEPPEKTLFIFATTDPQKMLDTLKNRAQLQLAIKKPDTKDLCGLLKRVCLDKGKDYDMQGLRMICAKADYVIRNSLNYLETVLKSRDSATAESVASEFEEIADNLIFDFYKAYIEKDYFSYINILYKIKVNYDFGMFLQSLTNFTTRGIYIINNVTVEGMSEVEIDSYLKVFSQFSPEDIAYILSSLKKMPYGDIETNLMSFIFTTQEKVEEKPKIEMPTESLSRESKLRNDNKEILENVKLSKGRESLKSSMEEVSFNDAMSLFTLEKVSEED